MASNLPKGLAHEDLRRIYRSLRLIRRVEERVAGIYPSNKIKSPVHLSIGQEAISVGICDVLRDDDVVAGTYRGHALYLAKGGGLDGFMAEMYGKADGCARGKGGSMHLVDMSRFILGGSAVVATHIPIALGYALKLKHQGDSRAVACFFGDGATEEGTFYESLNFASLHKLPVFFVCENNALAIHAPLEKRWATSDVGKRVEGFGIPAGKVDDLDVFRIREFAEEALERIRDGCGPEFLECTACRWRAHVGPNEEFNAAYRSSEDFDDWISKDQVARLAEMLSGDDREHIDQEIEAEIDKAVEFAENSPFPAIEELETDVVA